MLCNRDYLNESYLPRIQRRLAMAGAVAVLVLVAFSPLVTMSQTSETLRPAFARAIIAVHHAESAGAPSSEIAGLVALLNKALELNSEAAKLTTTNDTARQDELLMQVDQTLATVETQAGKLAVTASQRSNLVKTFVYAWGIIAAFLGTFLFDFLVTFYHKYRIKRTFQMKVTRK